MIALGGSIGTGLFVASGASIHSAGPGGALAAYAAIGIMVYFLMTSLGEMATYMPVTGSYHDQCHSPAVLVPVSACLGILPGRPCCDLPHQCTCCAVLRRN